jgi:hypothetical protein
MTTTLRFRVIASLGACLVGAGLLSGCAGNDAPKTTHSATRSSAPDTNGATSSATPTPTETPTPVNLTCDQLLTAQQLYDYNPNFGTDPGYKPAAGGPTATAVQYGGVSCGWLNQTSKSVLEVAVAMPTRDQLTQLTNAAVSGSHVVPTYGVPPTATGYFNASAGGGVAQVFTGKWWVVASSKDFFEPGDAQPVMSAVLQNLPKG